MTVIWQCLLDLERATFLSTPCAYPFSSKRELLVSFSRIEKLLCFTGVRYNLVQLLVSFVEGLVLSISFSYFHCLEKSVKHAFVS